MNSFGSINPYHSKQYCTLSQWFLNPLSNQTWAAKLAAHTGLVLYKIQEQLRVVCTCSNHPNPAWSRQLWRDCLRNLPLECRGLKYCKIQESLAFGSKGFCFIYMVKVGWNINNYPAVSVYMGQGQGHPISLILS